MTKETPVYETDGHRWYAFIGLKQVGYDPLVPNSGHFPTKEAAELAATLIAGTHR